MSDLHSGLGWVGGAITLATLVARLYLRRADIESKRLEREAQHLRHMQEQVDQLKAQEDFRAVELRRLSQQVLSGEVRRAQLEVELEQNREQLVALRHGVEDCEREREDEQRRSEALARELGELKRELSAGRVTPIRPPPKKGA